MKIKIVVILTLLLVPFLLVFVRSKVNAAAPYCPTGPYGYETGTSSSTYTAGQPVNFCLANNTRDPLYASPEWKILDANSNVVYELPAGPIGTTPLTAYEAGWDQTNSRNEQVTPGQYEIIFPGIPGEAKATFTITGSISPSSESSSQASSSLASSISSESSSSSSTPATGLIPPANLNQTVWYPVSLTQNMMSSYYLTGGATTAFTGTMANYSSQTQTVLVDIEIYNASSKESVARVSWDNVAFQPFETKNFSLTSPSGLAPGQYFVAVGVYTAGGGPVLGWYAGYQNFTVAK